MNRAEADSLFATLFIFKSELRSAKLFCLLNNFIILKNNLSWIFFTDWRFCVQKLVFRIHYQSDNTWKNYCIIFAYAIANAEHLYRNPMNEHYVHQSTVLFLVYTSTLNSPAAWLRIPFMSCHCLGTNVRSILGS